MTIIKLVSNSYLIIYIYIIVYIYIWTKMSIGFSFIIYTLLPKIHIPKYYKIYSIFD